jgi:hypothetical protein
MLIRSTSRFRINFSTKRSEYSVNPHVAPDSTSDSYTWALRARIAFEAEGDLFDQMVMQLSRRSMIW